MRGYESIPEGLAQGGTGAQVIDTALVVFNFSKKMESDHVHTGVVPGGSALGADSDMSQRHACLQPLPCLCGTILSFPCVWLLLWHVRTAFPVGSGCTRKAASLRRLGVLRSNNDVPRPGCTFLLRHSCWGLFHTSLQCRSPPAAAAVAAKDAVSLTLDCRYRGEAVVALLIFL